MEWYEWVFDGIGTAIIGFLSGLISYKAAVKKMSKQVQKAGNDSKQKQEMTIENTEEGKNVQRTIKQVQKAGNNATQVQTGRFENGKQKCSKSR